LHQERLAIDPRRAALDLTEVDIDDFAIALEDIDLGVVRKILVGATLTEWLERNRKFICILCSTLASRLGLRDIVLVRVLGDITENPMDVLHRR